MESQLDAPVSNYVPYDLHTRIRSTCEKTMHSDQDSQYDIVFAVFLPDISYTDIFGCLANLKGAISYAWLTVKIFEAFVLFCPYH